LIDAANQDVNMYGGPGRGDVRNKPKVNSTAPDPQRGDPRPHKYDPETDFGM
jgi:hypothetical protein